MFTYHQFGSEFQNPNGLIYRESLKRAVNKIWPILLKYFDGNKTGRISRTEYKNGMKKRGKPYHQSRWNRLDLNRNGLLNKIEFYHAMIFSKCPNGGVGALSSSAIVKTCVGIL